MQFPRVLSLLALCALALPSGAGAGQVTVFAAASLKTALDRIEPLFEQASGHELTVVLAGTSVLARQILAGAPADIFLSANPEWMDELESADLLQPGTRQDLLGNRLVVIGPKGTDAAGLQEGNATVAMALVDAVPAGIYGKAALENLGLWEQVEPRVVQTANVRAALALVALKAVPLGVVYATDAKADPRVAVIQELPGDSHPPIRYPVAALNASEGTAALLAFLTGAEAGEVFADLGFTLLEGGS